MDINYISPEDISVVVQGPVDKYTRQCLESIRKILPEAEIILSIWEEDAPKVYNLEFDILVVSADPGGYRLNTENLVINNVNRQILGVKAGLNKVQRKYTLKFRTNMDLVHSYFLEHYIRYGFNAEHFEQALLILDYYTRNPRVVPLPYHISDWILFGLTRDIKRFYSSVSLQSEDEGLYYLNRNNQSPIFKYVLARYTPEQHILYSFLKKKENISFFEYFDNSSENIFKTEKFIIRNLIILNLKNSGMRFLKYSPNRFFEYSTLISETDWKYLRLINENNIWVKVLYFAICCIRKFIFFYLRGSIVKIIRRLRMADIIKNIMGVKR